MGWLLMFHQDNHFFAEFRWWGKSHATKTKHTKQNYRVIFNLLFRSQFSLTAHKLQCCVELCLLFIFGESVTIEIENLKKKITFPPSPLIFWVMPPCSLYPSSLFHVLPSSAFSIVFSLFLFYQQTIFSDFHPNMMGIFLYESRQNTEWMWGWD